MSDDQGRLKHRRDLRSFYSFHKSPAPQSMSNIHRLYFRSKSEMR
ncbi:unnamed protein product [Chironomus riparius]|uniref:Uncharacterized protein n=1 Tax=Chironomus riparius TaxID=315576 RepID=A0A9N9WSP8_9DIPT|nr:unnamed protein product [Chironomus riparius]